MIEFLLILLLVLALVSAIAILTAVSRGKRIKQAEEALQTLGESFRLVTEKAMRLQKALDKNAKAEGDANAERKELKETLDSDLVRRANSLFK